MAGRLHALLVGIDEYPLGVRSLSGCCNDVRHVAEFLAGRAGDGAHAPVIQRLENAAATRDAVIAGFREGLAAAASGDVALFYFSGHGSQEPAPPELLRTEPDRLLEGLVCHDSRQHDSFNLADKELAVLLAEVAARGAHVLVVLDCCHSGTATRSPADPVRRTAADDRARPIERFLSGVGGDSFKPASGWTSAPAAHVLMAACHDREEAREVVLDGEHRGVFSYYLLETLRQAVTMPTYRDLHRRVAALVRTRATLQTPQLEGFGDAERDRAFLGGLVAGRKPYVTVSHDRVSGWVMDAGAVHGIPAPGDETTRLAVFPAMAGEGHDDLADAVGSAVVVEVLPGESRVALEFGDGAAPDPACTYDGVVVALPLSRLPVAIEGDSEGVALARAALAEEGADAPSLYVAEIDASHAEYRLQAIRDASGERLRLVPAGEPERPVVSDVAGFGPLAVQTAMARLCHISRWTRLADLRNRVSGLDPDAVRMRVHLIEDGNTLRELSPTEGDLVLSYRRDGGEWRCPHVKISLENTTDRELHCILLDLTETFGVFTDLLPGGRVTLPAGETVWAYGDRPIPVVVPDAYAARGYTELKDVIKLIVSTAPAHPDALRQDDLETATRRSRAGAGLPVSTLDRLLQRVGTRHIGGAAGEERRVADWITSEIGLSVRRPLDAAVVPEPGGDVSLAPGVRVHGHHALAGATVRLAPAPDVVRALDRSLPPILLDDPTISRPLELIDTRSGRPGASAIELEIADPQAMSGVSEDDPLVLRLDGGLEDGEHVLPLTWDGEFFLPLGKLRRAHGSTDLLIERLPPPDTRGVTSSVRILLQKIVGRRLGVPYEYPLLRAIEVVGDRVVHVDDPALVGGRVAAAERILVCIHGLVGDTRGMAEALAPSGGFDLVLGFDYESINTPVSETARELRARLADAGLDRDHGKSVVVVAHSLGGLVARWFVEQESGAQIVDRVAMLGTPNGGSPWATLQGWATTALGVALNGLGAGFWPAQVLPALLELVEAVDTTLDALQPGSELLESLARHPDPGVPYVVLAGDTSVSPAAPADQARRLARLVERLRVRELAHGALGLAFFGRPNDIAVSVSSARQLPSGWAAVAVEEVGCDHMTYFRSAASREALQKALAGG